MGGTTASACQPPRKTGRSCPLPWRLLPSVLSLARLLGEARAQGQDSSASAAYRLFDRRTQASSHLSFLPTTRRFCIFCLSSHPNWRFITRPLSRRCIPPIGSRRRLQLLQIPRRPRSPRDPVHIDAHCFPLFFWCLSSLCVWTSFV